MPKVRTGGRRGGSTYVDNTTYQILRSGTVFAPMSQQLLQMQKNARLQQSKAQQPQPPQDNTPQDNTLQGNTPAQPNEPQSDNKFMQIDPKTGNYSVGNNANLATLSDNDIITILNKADSFVGAQLPTEIRDREDGMQRLAYAAGLNEKPDVMGKSAFDTYMKQNNMASTEVMCRGINNATYRGLDGNTYNVSADVIRGNIMYSDIQYIGGKQGGQALGAGLYMDKGSQYSNFSTGTGYGSTKLYAVLNKSKVKAVSDSAMPKKIAQYKAKHPAVAAKVDALAKKYNRSGGGYGLATAQSMYASLMGYNVITSWDSRGQGYTNIIDRSVLVIRHGKKA